MGTGLANRRTVSDPKEEKPGPAGLFLLLEMQELSHFPAFAPAGTLAAVTDPVKPIDGAFSSGEDAMSSLSTLLDRLANAYRLPPQVMTDLRIALDEVVSNIVKYGYADNAHHDITIHWEIRSGRLETRIEDDGIAFDPLRAPEPDLAAPLATRRAGGLGVHFVKKLMNSVTYERVDGRNRLTLKQDLGSYGSGS